MALSKKHFERIASDIEREVGERKRWLEHVEGQTGKHAAPTKDPTLIHLHNFAVNFCTFARQENPNFDGQRFLKACGF